MLLANAKAPQRYKETNTKNSLIQRAPETGEKHQRRAGDQKRFYVTFNKRLGWIVRRAPMFSQFNWQSANKTDEFRVISSGIFCKRKTVQYKYHLVFVRYFSMSFGQTPQLSHDLAGGKRFTRGYKALVFVPKKLRHKQRDPRDQNTMPLRSPKYAYFFVFVPQTPQQRFSYIAFQHPNTFLFFHSQLYFYLYKNTGFIQFQCRFSNSKSADKCLNDALKFQLRLDRRKSSRATSFQIELIHQTGTTKLIALCCSRYTGGLSLRVLLRYSGPGWSLQSM